MTIHLKHVKCMITEVNQFLSQGQENDFSSIRMAFWKTIIVYVQFSSKLDV